MSKGWVKIFREVQDSFLWESKEPYDKRSAWIDLILLANHQDIKMMYGGKVVEEPRGTVCRSIAFLAKRWRWSRHKVTDYLNCLQKQDMIRTSIGTGASTSIFLINYEKYQGGVVDEGQGLGHFKDRSGTGQGQVKDRSGTPNKNVKNVKNVKKEEEGDARAREGAAAIPLEDGTEYIITNTQLEQLVQRYPGLDVRRELIRAVNWCKDNPEKLKPRSGAWRFVTGWLTRAEKDREAAEAAPVVVRSAAAKNSFHNFEERENTHLDDLFPGDIVNAEVG